jgi:hypothetical protein
VRIDRWALDEFQGMTKVAYLQDVTPDMIESFSRRLREAGLAPSSINIHLRHLSRLAAGDHVGGIGLLN